MRAMCSVFGVAPLLSVLAIAHVAMAEPRAYRGPHPLDAEGHWHMDEQIHVHETLAVGLDPFADVDGALVFLGDPGAYGFPGQMYVYEGAHPLPAPLAGYCGISGSHRHIWFPEGTYRRNTDGAYVFDGTMRGGVPTYVPGRAPEAVRPPSTPLVARPLSAFGTYGYYGYARYGTLVCAPGMVPRVIDMGGGARVAHCVIAEAPVVRPRPALVPGGEWPLSPTASLPPTGATPAATAVPVTPAPAPAAAAVPTARGGVRVR